MADGKTLKEQNAWLIRAIMILHMLAFTWITLKPIALLSQQPAAALAKVEAAALPGTVTLGLIAIASLLLLGLVPPNWRDSLIHWRWSQPLPGARAFTVIGPRSSRIDMAALETRFGPLPSDRSQQDSLFYKIYRQFRDEDGVLDAHKSYLATRDVGTINAILMIPLPVMTLVITGDLARSAVYFGALVAAYIACAVSAQNYATRMVQNVLALAAGDQST